MMDINSVFSFNSNTERYIIPHPALVPAPGMYLCKIKLYYTITNFSIKKKDEYCGKNNNTTAYFSLLSAGYGVSERLVVSPVVAGGARGGLGYQSLNLDQW